MADRYWVGGSGNWDASDTTHWSASSGGASGASVPTSSDAVIFDSNSGSSATVTITGATANAASITINKSDLTLLHNAGSTVTGTMTLTTGTLNTNGQTCSWGGFSSSNSNARTLTLGASAITITGGGAPAWSVNYTNLTVSAAQGTVTFGSTNANAITWNGGGQTWGTVNRVAAGASRGAFTIQGSNTIGTLNVTNSAGAHVLNLTAGTTQTITRTLNVNGISGGACTLQSTSAGSPATISKSFGVVSLDYLSVKDITCTGGALFFAGANSTSVSGNTGISFFAPTILTAQVKVPYCYHFNNSTSDSGLTFAGSKVGSDGTNIWGTVALPDLVNIPTTAEISAVRLVSSVTAVSGAVPTINLWYNNTAGDKDGGPPAMSAPWIPPASDHWTSGLGYSDTTRGTFTVDLNVFEALRNAPNWILFLPETDNEGGAYELDFDQTDAIIEVDYALPTAAPTETTDGAYTVLKFTESGMWTPPRAMNIELLLAGAGGGGGGKSGRGAGGGAGRYITKDQHAVTIQKYAVIVGQKGLGSKSPASGVESTKGWDGGLSSFDGIVAPGGGGGGGGPDGSAGDGTNLRDGRAGGSGGGASTFAGSGVAGTTVAGTGVTGSGNNGGIGLEAASGYGAGGGGGSGAVGGNGSATNGGNGGAGTQNDITGSNLYYCAGGGGGVNEGTPGSGGSSIGGNGARQSPDQDATAAAANTGSGGGGGTDSNVGADGSDGVFIARFLTTEGGSLNSAPSQGLGQNAYHISRTRGTSYSNHSAVSYASERKPEHASRVRNQ